jgi:hypothetical protein
MCKFDFLSPLVEKPYYEKKKTHVLNVSQMHFSLWTKKNVGSIANNMSEYLQVLSLKFFVYLLYTDYMTTQIKDQVFLSL